MDPQPSLFDELEEGTDLEKAFRKFHRENPVVWSLFDRYTRQAAEKLEHCGVSLIWERLRWHQHFETHGEPFKLNNNHRAYYARLWMARNPEFAGFFETRETRGEREAP